MIFPYDSNSRFSDPKAASGDRDSGQSGHVFSEGKTVQPTQRPASNSDARKRAGEPGFSPADDAFGRQSAGLDPHLDNGFAEVIRKAKEKAWDEGHLAGTSFGWQPGQHVNPYAERAS